MLRSLLPILALLAGTGRDLATQDHPWSVPVPDGATPEQIASLAGTVRPHRRQQDWLDLEFTAFVHFGMNTFTDREWGDGQESPATFAPSAFDAAQWVDAFAAAGMRGVVLTCKHHDGFCLWPTATTAHSVKSSPWRDGKGDVVRAVADACRAKGLRFGIYLSPWDRNAPSFGSKAYDDLFHAQLHELLSRYAPIYDVWFDGAHAPKDDPSVFDWTRHYRLVRELQPDACISVMGPDVRWCGNEAGHTRNAEWNVIPLRGEVAEAPPTDSYASLGALLAVDVQARDLGSRERLTGAKRLTWWPAMTNTSIRPGWFYHPSQDDQVKGLDHLLDVYYGAVGGGTQFLLNVPPDRRGLVHENDVARLRQLGAVLRTTFAEDLAADATRTDADGTVTLLLPAPRTFDVVRLREDVRGTGQRVESFVLESRGDDGVWSPLPRGRGQTIGPNRLLRLLRPVTTRALRLRIERARGPATISTLALHRQPVVLRAPRIERAADGTVSLHAGPGVTIRYHLGEGPFPADAKRYERPFALPEGGVVQARSEPGAQAGLIDLGAGVEALRRFGLCRAEIRIHDCDSEQAPGEAARLAIDGDPSTLWHSRWSPDSPGHPHWITLDLGRAREVTGLVYLPRETGSNGTITRCSVEGSVDGTTWRLLLPATELANVANNPVAQELSFHDLAAAQRTVRYVRLRSHAAVDGRPWASAAELEVLVR